MSAYFDALGDVFSELALVLPEVAVLALMLLAAFGWLALLRCAVACFIVDDSAGWRVWLFGILAGPVNTLLVLAPLIAHLDGAGQ